MSLQRLQDIAGGYRGSKGKLTINDTDATELADLAGEDVDAGFIQAPEFCRLVDQATKNVLEAARPQNVQTAAIQDVEAEPNQPQPKGKKGRSVRK